MNETFTRNELEKIYDSLYSKAEKILNNFNPCEHKVISNEHQCLGKLDNSVPKGQYGSNTTKQCCCIGCDFWTEKGCGADKPLACKTWLCGISRLKYPKIKEKLDKIQFKAIHLNIYYGRRDKKYSIDMAMT